MRSKLLLLFLSVLLIFSLAGCGDNTASWATFDASLAGESAADVDIEDTTLSKPAFQMGEYVFYLGDIALQDLLNSGATAAASDNDVEDEGEDGELITVSLQYDDSNFTVIAENRTGEMCEINGYTVTDIYFADGDFKVSGGLGLGNTINDFTDIYGEPFSQTAGGDVSDDYEGITAYYFVSAYADDVMCVFVDDDSSYILSVRISEAKDYITDIDDITTDTLESWIEEYMTDIETTPAIYGVDGTDSIDGTYDYIAWTTASLYALDDIGDLDDYNLDADSITDSTPNVLLVVEYTAVIDYDPEDIADLAIETGTSVKESYTVYGCFFIIDPVITDDGIESAVTSTLLHSTGMVYTSEEDMLSHVFYASERGYDESVYTKQSVSLSE